MDSFSGRQNRQGGQREVAPSQPVARPVAEAPRTRSEMPKQRSKKSLTLTIAAVLAALLLLAGAFFGYRAITGSTIDSGKYQAVFLTNGQVYFGKLQRLGDYYKLTNVYYLQASQSADGSNSPQQAADAKAEGGVQLIKLGNEVHGPEDAMVIDKSQVLFFENLKNDGKVVESITSYQKK